VQLRRLALAVLVLGSTVPAVPALAAAKPKPVCLLVKDDAGDGSVKPAGVNSPALDILSADVSSGRTQVTATLRLKSGSIESDPALTGGAIWNFNVTVTGVSYSFYARWPSVVTLSPRVLYGGLTAGNDPSKPAATFRRVGNDFVWTVARSAFSGLAKPKTPIVVMGASSGADSLSADSAPAAPNTKYIDKTPSCLVSK
jgi:hypothetical protein